MNEILDLRHDLHAKDFALCEEYTFGIRTRVFAFPFLSEKVALRSLLAFSSRLLLTLQLSALVPWSGRDAYLFNAWHCFSFFLAF